MSRFSKLISKIMGIEDFYGYDTNFEMLTCEQWEILDFWHGLVLYQKEDKRIIYNSENDEIVRKYRIN